MRPGTTLWISCSQWFVERFACLKPCSRGQVNSHGMSLDEVAVEGRCLDRHLLLGEPHVGRYVAALLMELALDHRHLWLVWEDKDSFGELVVWIEELSGRSLGLLEPQKSLLTFLVVFKSGLAAHRNRIASILPKSAKIFFKSCFLQLTGRLPTNTVLASFSGSSFLSLESSAITWRIINNLRLIIN